MKHTLALVLMVFGIVGCTPEYKENGFSNQQTYEAAMQGGFLSEKDYRKAKKYNYTTKQEWDDAIALSKDKGYHSLDEYLSMSKTNLTTTYLECDESSGYGGNWVLIINQDNFESGSVADGKIIIENFKDTDSSVKISIPIERGYSPIIQNMDRVKADARKTRTHYHFNTHYKGIYDYQLFELDKSTLVMVKSARYSKHWEPKDVTWTCKKISPKDYLDKRKKYVELAQKILASHLEQEEKRKNTPKEF
jgi:hypothetical protein